MNNQKYIAEYRLHSDEVPAKINKRTGETTELKSRPNNIPMGKEVFEPDAIFRKDYTNSWRFLQKTLTALEFKAAMGLALMAKANTNSLEPINDETGVRELSERLDVSVNKVTSVIKKLYDLGVYGKFSVAKVDTPYKKFWILNPYLSFSGKLIESDIAELFEGTHIQKAFYNPDYQYIKDKE